jgi:hypothetical protein
MRYRLSTNGSRTRTVGFPAGLPTGQDGTCARVLVAAYAGAPPAEVELPTITRDLAASGDADVRFGTERVGAYRLLPPQDSAQCDPDRPTTSPSPSGSTTWNIDHP